MSQVKRPTGWVLFQAMGSHDDFRLEMIGYFVDEGKAKDKYDKVCNELDTFKSENPKPSQEAYMVGEEVDYSAYRQAYKDWRDNNQDNELFDTRYYVLEEWADGDREFIRQYKSFNHREI